MRKAAQRSRPTGASSATSHSGGEAHGGTPAGWTGPTITLGPRSGWSGGDGRKRAKNRGSMAQARQRGERGGCGVDEGMGRGREGDWRSPTGRDSENVNCRRHVHRGRDSRCKGCNEACCVLRHARARSRVFNAFCGSEPFAAHRPSHDRAPAGRLVGGVASQVGMGGVWVSEWV
eukprot:8901818-Prorocentrum_lima.AAC.1